MINRIIQWVAWSRKRAIWIAVILAVGLITLGKVQKAARATPRVMTQAPVVSTTTTSVPSGSFTFPTEPATTIPVVPTTGPGVSTVQPTPGITAPGASAAPDGLLATALTFVVNWAQPNADPTAWRGVLDKLTTPDLASGLAYADPSNVPATKVTGIPYGTGDSGGGTVAVPTDAGVVTLILIADGTGGWRVSTIEPSR